MIDGADVAERACEYNLSEEPFRNDAQQTPAPEEGKVKRKSAYRRKAEAEIESKRFYNDLKDELCILERMNWTEKRWREESKLEKGRAILQELQRGLPRVLDQLGLKFQNYTPWLARVEQAVLTARQRGDQELLRHLRAYSDDSENDCSRTDWHTLFDVQRQFCALPAFRATKYLEPSSIRHPLRCAEVLNRPMFKKGRYIGGANALSKIRFPTEDYDNGGALRQDLRRQLLEELRGQCVARDQSIEEVFSVQIQLVIRSGGSEFIWMPGDEVRLQLGDRVYYEQSHIWSEEKRSKLYTGATAHEMKRRLKCFERLLTGGSDDCVCEEEFEFVEMTARSDGGVANGVPEYLNHSVTGSIEHAEQVFERSGKAKGWLHRPKALCLRELFGTNLAGYRRQQGREIEWAPGPELFWATGDRPLRLLRMAHEPVRVRFWRSEEPFGFHLHDRGGSGGVEVIEVVPHSVADSRGIVVGRTVKRLLYGGRVEYVQNWSRAAIDDALQKMPHNFTIEFGKGDTEERHHAPIADAEMATIMEERFMRGFLHEVADAKVDDIKPDKGNCFDSDGWSKVFPDLGPTFHPPSAHQAFVLSETTVQAVMGASGLATAPQKRLPSVSSRKNAALCPRHLQRQEQMATGEDTNYPQKLQAMHKEENEMDQEPKNDEEVESNLKGEHRCELNQETATTNESDVISQSPPAGTVSWMWSIWSRPACEDSDVQCNDMASCLQGGIAEGGNGKAEPKVQEHMHDFNSQRDVECITEFDHVMRGVESVVQSDEEKQANQSTAEQQRSWTVPPNTDLSQFSSGPLSWMCFAVWGQQQHDARGELSERDKILQEISVTLANKELCAQPVSCAGKEQDYVASHGHTATSMTPVASTTEVSGIPGPNGWCIGNVRGHPTVTQGHPGQALPWIWCPKKLPEPSWTTTESSTATLLPTALSMPLPEEMLSHASPEAYFQPSPKALTEMYAEIYAQRYDRPVPIHSSLNCGPGALELDACSPHEIQLNPKAYIKETDQCFHDVPGVGTGSGQAVDNPTNDRSPQTQLYSGCNSSADAHSTAADSAMSSIWSVFDFSNAFRWESTGNEMQQTQEDRRRQDSPMRVPLNQSSTSLPEVAKLLHVVGTPPGLDLQAP